MTIKQKIFKANWYLVLFLSAVMLCAQVSAFEHEVEHHSHDDQELCQNFLAFDSSSDKTFYTPHIAVATYSDDSPIAVSTVLGVDVLYVGLIRAPPSIKNS